MFRYSRSCLCLVGAFLPVLPSTHFRLAATALYGRAALRFYDWLLHGPTFGPTVRAWPATRSVPRRAKRVALVRIATAFTTSVHVVPLHRAKLAMGALGVSLFVWMAR